MATAKKSLIERQVINDLQDVVLKRWPDARFVVRDLPDGEGIGVFAYTSGDFLDISRETTKMELDAMDEHGVFVYVIPMPPEAWED